MAHAYYNAQWQKAMEELSDLLEIENPPTVLDATGKPTPPAPITWDEAYKHFAILYIRYILVFRKLEECYDQMLHPQKRRDIRVVLDATIARITQLKNNLYTYGPGGHQTDFPHLDGFLVALGLTPEDIEIPIPRYFRERRPEEEQVIQNRMVLARCMDELGVSADPEPSSTASNLLLSHMTREQAVQTIQRNERGRQGAQRAQLAKEIKLDNQLRARSRADAGLGRSVHASATLIQRLVRGWLTRKRVKQETYDELVFLGMVSPPAADGTAYDPVAKETQVRKTRKARQADHEVGYIEALGEAAAQVQATVGAEVKDALWQERYEWWVAEKERTGKAPKSLAAYYAHVEAQKRAALPAADEPAPEPKARAGRAPTRSGSSLGGRGRADPAAASTVLLEPSPLVAALAEGLCRYSELWARLDEADNLAQTHDLALARARLLPLARERVREEVDSELLAYVGNLQAKVKKAKKKKKASAPAAEPGKPKEDSAASSAPAAAPAAPRRKAAGPRLEGERACGGLSLQQTMGALVQMGVLREGAAGAPLASFLGDADPAGSAGEAAGAHRDPSLGQLRRAVADSVVLPLGCPAARLHAPEVTSLLLYGARGTGKTLLARAIAHDTQAVTLDLSPARVAGRVHSKADVQRLCYMAFRVAREVQPAVVLLDDCEQLFCAKGSGPRGRAALYSQLRRSIALQRKALPPGARVLVLGTSRQPFAKNVSARELGGFFGRAHRGRMWYCPCPDHAARLKLWAHGLRRAGLAPDFLQALAPSLSLSLLARVSEGFSAGAIEQACAATFTPRRVERLRAANTAKFDVSELLRTLAKTPYLYMHQYNQFANFTFAVSGHKGRLRMLQEAEAEEAETKRKAANQPKVAKAST